MPNIQHYEFGKIIIDNKIYTSDVIIYPDRIDSNWYRKQGHILLIEDIKEVIAYKPETIIVGTGIYGVMLVMNETKKFIKNNNIELIVLTTDEAVYEYNKISKTTKVVACLHLTC